MNLKSYLTYEVLWIAHPLLQFAVATAMFRRKQYRVFPVFSAYLVFQIAGFMILFPVYMACTYAVIATPMLQAELGPIPLCPPSHPNCGGLR